MTSSMTSSMTSHATIGNSTFAPPRSSDTTMSSIDGPSDFTANVIDYMKGSKATNNPKSSYLRTRVNSNPKLRLDPDQSGVVIESHSEFGDDTVDYLGCNKAMYSPARSEKSDVDGPSDFTDNLMAYLKGHKASPQSVTSKAAREPPPAKASLQSLVSSATKTPQTATTANASPQSLANKTAKKATMAQASPQQVIGTKVDQPVSSTTISPQHTSGAPEGTQPASPIISPERAVNRLEIRATVYREQDETASAGEAPSPSTTDANCLPKLHRNLVISGPPDFTTSIAAFINNGTAIGTHATHTISEPNCTIRPMSAPAKGQQLDMEGLPDFKASLGDYINEVKKESICAVHSPVDDPKSAKPSTVAAATLATNSKGNCESCKTSVLSRGERGAERRPLLATTTFTPHSQASSSATVAGAGETGDDINNGASDLQEELRQQIAKLQAQLQHRDDTILELQTRVITTEEKGGELGLELESKNATINSLHKSLEDSHEKCGELESELHQTKSEWQARAQLLMREVDRRGAACMQLWGQLENPGQTDGEGRQKYTYKYTKKSVRGAPVV